MLLLERQVLLVQVATCSPITMNDLKIVTRCLNLRFKLNFV